jgi:uncharacterized protein with HEPN domain
MKPHDYLRDLLDYLSAIEQFTVDGHEAFMSDRKTQFAVIRAYEVIGEIVKRLPDAVYDSYPAVDWQKLMNFRDFLAHNYERVLLNNIWAAIVDLPNLRSGVELVLRSMPEDETPSDQ